MRSETIFQKKWVGKDLLAGLAVFLVAVPTSLGIAQTLNLPLASGIIAGIVGGVLVGLLSGSHTSVSGPSPGLIGLLLAQLAVLQSFEALLMALVIAGWIQIVLGVAGAGFLSSFVPRDVIRGLLAALGVILILKQLPHLLGHDSDPEGEMSFWQPDRQTTFSELSAMTGDYQIGAAVVGILSVVVLLAWDYRRPKQLGFLPGALLVVLLGVVLQALFGRLGGGWQITGIQLLQVPLEIGPDGIADLFRHPDFSVRPEPSVYFAGAMIALVASLETMVNLQAVDHIDTRRRRSPVNREFVAQGVGNLTCGLIGGLPMASLVVHSSVNIHAGGRSRRATIFHGLFFFVFVLFLPQVLNLIPLASLAAILFVTGIKLIRPAQVRRMWDGGRSQFVPFLVTVLAIVFTDLVYGVLIGLSVSLGFILHDNLRRPLRRIVEKHLNEEVLHIELGTQVSFLSAGVLDRTLAELPDGTHVHLDATDTEYIDPDILMMIKEFCDFTASQRNIKVSLTGFNGDHQLLDQIQFVDYSSRELQSAISPAQVLKIMQEGNERFRTGNRLPRDLRAQIHGSAFGQFPLAVVLSCIDSRTPVEVILDLGLGDIFSVRVAGNVTGPNLLGSMEYGTAVAGAKLIVVMGHTSCGAVNAAVKLAHGPDDYEQATGCQNLAPIVDKIKMSIDRDDWLRQQEASAEDKAAYADEVAKANVLRVLGDILVESRTIKRLVDEGRVALIGAMYDVKTAEIEFFVDDAIGLDITAEEPASVTP